MANLAYHLCTFSLCIHNFIYGSLNFSLHLIFLSLVFRFSFLVSHLLALIAEELSVAGKIHLFNEGSF